MLVGSLSYNKYLDHLKDLMRTYFVTPIKTLEDAHAFFTALHAEHLLFHPENAPETIIDYRGMPLFTAEEAAEITKRIDEVYAVDSDPCAFILDTLNPFKI